MSINLSILCFRAQEKSVDLVAHADDVTIFESASADIQLMWDLLLTYERAKVARLNIRKSKAMAASS